MVGRGHGHQGGLTSRGGLAIRGMASRVRWPTGRLTSKAAGQEGSWEAGDRQHGAG